MSWSADLHLGWSRCWLNSRILRQYIQVHLDPQNTLEFLFKGERWRYKDPWTHQKTHSMIDGDSNGARLVGPRHQISVGRPAFSGSHLPAPLCRPPGPSRRLRVAPPHKISCKSTYDVGPPKVGYSPPTLATCGDDLGRLSKAVPMTVYPMVEKWEAHGSLMWHPLYSPYK